MVTAWHAETPEHVAELLGTDLERGLSSEEAAARLGTYGPNQLKEESKASVWEVALGQLRDPMNIMLVVVAIASLIIGQVSTAFVVLLLVLLNLGLGTRQELAARASVDALAQMQVPEARVVRDGTLVAIPAIEVVPGDLLAVESGDIVAADGRLARAPPTSRPRRPPSPARVPPSRRTPAWSTATTRRWAIAPTWSSRTRR